MNKTDIGIIGLGVMAENLIINLERNGYSVVIYNRTQQKIMDFLERKRQLKNITGAKTIEEFCQSLTSPREVLLMIKSGNPVDSTIDALLPYLDKDDIIMDCGNSFFKDTIRRSKFLKEKNIRFLGVGISGGAEGALKGPSIMPGGDKDAWFRVKEILQSISAKIEDHPCCKYLGSNGAGHYVKMVHNGIEYAIMQAIAESYHLLRDIFKLSPQKLVEVYTSWNNGELNSYLLEITRNIFETVDPETGKPLIDFIVDIAGQKGTGNWTAQNALEMGIPSNSLAQAVFARIFSANKRLRIEFAKNTNHPEKKELEISNKQKEDLRQALYCTILCAYTQGFAQLQSAKHEYNWEYDLIDISRIWQNGCIIRADLLKKIYKAFQNNPNLENLLIDTHFAKKIDKYQRAWRSINCLAINFQIPVPVISSSLTFIDSLNTEHLPANLIQAQRDYFGAHTFRRIDRESKESFHHEW